MSCPVTPVLTVEEPDLEINIFEISPCDQDISISTVILYNGVAFYDGTYTYGMGQ